MLYFVPRVLKSVTCTSRPHLPTTVPSCGHVNRCVCFYLMYGSAGHQAITCLLESLLWASMRSHTPVSLLALWVFLHPRTLSCCVLLCPLAKPHRAQCWPLLPEGLLSTAMVSSIHLGTAPAAEDANPDPVSQALFAVLHVLTILTPVLMRHVLLSLFYR